MWDSIKRRITTFNILALYALLLMAYGTGLLVWSLAETIPPLSWPVMRGEVVRAHYVAEIHQTKFETSYVYVPVIRYRYAVDGQDFVSDRAWTGKPFTVPRLEDVEAFLIDYREGQPVSVRYDPGDPARSTLFVETDYGQLVTAGAGLFLLFLSWLICGSGRNGRVKPDAG
ncbi:MAG: DUF3592 domain-containing protein [Allorhizobium sp.]